MEERILCPIGLMLHIVAVPTHIFAVPLVRGFKRPAFGGIMPDNFLHRQHWPIQIRSPPALAVVQTTY